MKLISPLCGTATRAVASAVQIRGLIAITGPEAGLIECYLIVDRIPCLQARTDQGMEPIIDLTGEFSNSKC